MKNIILSAIFLAILGTTTAQESTFESSLKQTIVALDSTNKLESMAPIVDQLERISQMESQRWEAFYYLAYARIRYSFIEKDGQKKDALLDLAQKSITEALKLNGDKSELHALQGFLYQGRITVSASRGMTYSQKANSELAKALEINPNNPRALFLMGKNVYHTPKFFGGGAKNAVGNFVNARKLFEASKKQDELSPYWGAIPNKQMLDICVKELGEI